MSMFDHLLQNIESFYSKMQDIGIDNTQEIVDPMDCSKEEKNLRINFIHKVLIAKREYKSGIDKLKKESAKKAEQTADLV
jgi:hypothetical protein